MTALVLAQTAVDEDAGDDGSARSDAGPARVHAGFGGGVPSLERRGNDGYVLAEPYPMGLPARAAIRGLIRAVCPPAPAPQPVDMEDRIELQFRRMLRYMPPLFSWGLRAAVRALDHAPRLLFVSRRRLHRLAPEEGRVILARLAVNRLAPVREIVHAVRGVILSVYFDQDEVHRAMDYAPAPFMASRIGLRQRLLAGEQHTTADIIAVTPGLEA